MMKSIFPRQRKATGDGVVDGLSLFVPRGRLLYPPPPPPAHCHIGVPCSFSRRWRGFLAGG
jgi:hypothetical protein